MPKLLIKNFLLVTIVISFGVVAQENVEKFSHRAESFVTDFSTNVTTMEGDVVIESDQRKLTANKLQILGDTGQIICTGSVTYRQGPLYVAGEKADLNIKTGLGTFNDAVVQIGDQLYLEGKVVERYENERYRVQHGKVSLCQDCPQTWSIAGSSIDIRIEGYAEVHHALVQIKDTPIAYIPLMIFPIKSKRQSGVLPPRFKSDADMGFQVGVPYFWAISPDADTTFELRPMTKGGQRLWNETRYKFSERSYIEGLWSVNRNDQVLNLPSTRWGTSFQERVQLTPGLVQRYNGEWASDQKYSGHFEEDFRANRLPYLQHETNVTYQNSFFYGLAGARFQDDNVPRVLYKEVPQGLDQKSVQNYPDIQAYIPSYKLLGPLRLDSELNYLSLRRPYDKNSAKISGPIDPDTGFIRTGDRATFQTTLIAPLGTKYFTYKPQVMARIDHYSFHRPVYPASAHRVRFFYDQELSADVWQVFQIHNRDELKAVKHSVRPFVRWSHSPRDTLGHHDFFDQKNSQGHKSPKFDLFDPNSDAEQVSLGTLSEEQRLGQHHLLTTGIGTRVVGRYGEVLRRYEEHFGANISQDFNLIPGEKRLGNIFFDTFGAYGGFRLSTNMVVNPHNRNADVLNRVSYQQPRYSLSLFQSIQRTNKGVGGDASLSMVGPFSFSVLAVYDLLKNDWQEQEYSILYTSPSKCWLIRLTTRSTEGWWPIDLKPGMPSISLNIDYRPEEKKPKNTGNI